MTTQWMIKGPEFTNCNCTYACPCQFSWPEPDFGFCEAMVAGHIDEGYHGDTRLDGLNWAFLIHWPGPIAEGKGTRQVIIDERADDAQRKALERIITGKDTEPFATHFNVFDSTLSKALDTLYAKIDLEIDIDTRLAKVEIPGIVTSRGEPIKDDVNGEEHRVRIDLPNGFEYRLAEVGRGFTKSSAGVPLDLNNTYGQFCTLHMGNNGVID